MTRLTLAPKRRYLVRFDPKRIPHTFTDVLIIGGGIAGIRAALAVDPALQTVVVTKDVLPLSNSANTAASQNCRPISAFGPLSGKSNESVAFAVGAGRSV